ncbi:uncharacterized protein METZ01_LOCUS137737 [marine metagenome]|uniref:Uncharacterized protein n=1 Tax=marine metagenome TaxID=408172 RepID=A0A381Z7X9_9ZZZZ
MDSGPQPDVDSEQAAFPLLLEVPDPARRLEHPVHRSPFHNPSCGELGVATLEAHVWDAGIPRSQRQTVPQRPPQEDAPEPREGIREPSHGGIGLIVP